MSSTRQVRIIAVSAPAVNPRDVALSLRTECGDAVVCVLTRALALGLADAIRGALLPAAPAAGEPKTSQRRRCPRRLAEDKIAALRDHFPAYRRGETTLAKVSAATGVLVSTVSRYYTVFAREAAAERAPVLKPGGRIL